MKSVYILAWLISTSLFASEIKLRDCPRELIIIQLNPAKIGARPSDLEETVAKIEAQLGRLRSTVNTTQGRNALIIADLWIKEARRVIQERRATSGDAPNKAGGAVLGVSRLGEAVYASLTNPGPFTPIRPPVADILTEDSLPKSSALSRFEIIEMITSYQKEGEKGLDATILRLKGNLGVARELVFSKTPPTQEDYNKDFQRGLETLAECMRVGIKLVNEKKADEQLGISFSDVLFPNLSDCITTPEFILLMKNFFNRDVELLRIRNLIVSNPIFKSPIIANNSVDTYLLDPLSTLVPKEAFEPNVVALRGATEGVVTAFKSSLGTQGLPLRQVFEEMLNDDAARTALFTAANSDLKTISDELKASGYMAQNPKVDILFVGAGLHEQNAQNYLTQNDVDLDTLTLERAPIVAPTFDDGGTAVSLNSTSRGENPLSLRQVFGEGDLNFLPGGFIQLNMFSRQRNPSLVSFANVIQMNRAFSRGKILLETSFEGVQHGQEGPYSVLANTTLGPVSARAIIETGIGNPKMPNIAVRVAGQEISFADFIALSENDATDIRPPRVMLYPRMMRFLRVAKNPLKPFSELRIGVAGGGDSGKAIVRWLLGGANPESYKRDTTRVRGPAKILWYGQPANTCDEFRGMNRSFYADIGTGYQKNIIKAKNKLAVVNSLQDGRMNLLTDGQKKRGNAETNKLRNEDEEVDFLISAFGFDSPLDRYLSPLRETFAQMLNVGPPPSYGIRDIMGFEPSLGVVTFARQLVDSSGRPLPHYFIGPAAGNIIGEAELRNNEENSVANANHAWRVWRFMEALSLLLMAEKN